MAEINLMKDYPTTKRNLDDRILEKTIEDKIIAQKFGQEFFDGERKFGYGGYNYHPRFWTAVVREMINYYSLSQNNCILDVGCAKGFMLYDFTQALPGLKIRGIDISPYAIKNAKEEIKPYLNVGNAKDLGEFKDKEFDLVTSITTIHNLEIDECKKAIMEIERVGKNKFITVDAWRNEEEKNRMNAWNLTAKTFMSTDNWKKLFKEVGYTGDYYWFIP
jgi:ubiquinone/menaquinone biosynthesis C-methylase UbiE